MDTSKNYYESVMRDLQTYGQGRTLEHYCRDEGADYKWIEKAKEPYGLPAKGKAAKAGKKSSSKSPDMIRLHFEPEPSAPLVQTAGMRQQPYRNRRCRTQNQDGAWPASGSSLRRDTRSRSGLQTRRRCRSCRQNFPLDHVRPQYSK